ncbi:phage protein Gp37 [Accumulibacter sp.]|uniref:phage protein Gp37 n=1 Tax=Accumulibacter sp. TaxID=2053492 RepID=UPI0025D1D2E2|nr:phage protein Gp37 [Accumulibacter sp.]MCM8595137.1 DUF1834 family protein [Accumulibacter sp.]MCM8625523.1 DUF1834 family protein [Accumulibacter sp.]MDS4049283.1 DUF1834 family protein [Accumulibacter sp.]
MLIYAQLEDAVIDRLTASATSGALGYALAEVASYGGEFDDETFWTQVRRFPAAWVTVAGEKVKRLTERKYLCSPTLMVLVGTRNVRSERQTRHGTVSSPGSYQILDDVRLLLSGMDFDLPIKPLSPGPVKTLYNTRIGAEALSVFSIEFLTEYVFTLPDEASEVDWLRVGLNYYLLPGDALADASDLVTLS